MFTLIGCQESHSPSHQMVARSYSPAAIAFDTLTYQERMYVPVYSEIYFSAESQYFPLYTTLSVRNTSMSASLFVKTVDFYNTQGARIKQYLPQPIVLSPLQTVEFPGNYTDRGGSGAKFILEWGSTRSYPRPLVQAVMIGSSNQQGISFISEGVVVDTLKK